jgi:hypothetical protein
MPGLSAAGIGGYRTDTRCRRCQWHRCYRAVFLLPCDRAGERFVIVGLRVMRADQAEGSALWELLDTFVGAVGRDVLKVLIVDRGFIDGPLRRRARERLIIYRQQCFPFFTLLEHTELTLSLADKARRKALAKARRLLKEDHRA